MQKFQLELDELLPDDSKAKEVTKTNLLREFWINCQPENDLIRYTEATVFHRTLNLSLRQRRLDNIYYYRQIIINIMHCLRQSQPAEEDRALVTIYRGEQMTVFELDKLMKRVGEVVTVASFFSTSFSFKVAQIFAGNGSDNDLHMISVIFEIQLDTARPMRPYAPINGSEEDEVIFSPGT
ncbi:unnamed protein product, partial [Didymodactylos carnosus]